MVKKIGWCISLFVITLGLLEETIFCEETNFQYVPKVLFTIPYGTADTQVRIGAVIDPEGPCGFWIDKNGDIYINDRLNQKIKKFSKDGTLIFATEGEFDIGIGGFVVDDKGNIFADTGLNTTTKFDNKGKVVHHLDWSPFYESRHARDERKVMSSPSPQIAEIPNFKQQPLIDAQGNRYEVHYEGYDDKNKEPKTIVNVYNQRGKAIGSFTISPKAEKRLLQSLPKGTSSQVNLPDYEGIATQGISIKWVDGAGNLYGITEAKRKEPIILMVEHGVEVESGYVDVPVAVLYDEIIYKYNSQGKFITQLRYPGSISGLGQHGKVDKDGNIYCLQFHKDGMDVVKYEWKAVSKK